MSYKSLHQIRYKFFFTLTIFIFYSLTSTDESDWAVIELQGDIRTTHIEDSHFIGDLHYTNDGTPVLIIGNNLLMGKVTEFEKPIAVLEKTLNEYDETEYKVKALVKKKLLFRTRPKPVDRE